NFELVFPKTLDAGNLAKKYDVLVFPSGAISPELDKQGRVQRRGGQPDPQVIPAEWRDRLGYITMEKTIPQLRQFLNAGGTVLAIGSSASLGFYCDLPISNSLIDKATGKALTPEKYFAPGSVHQVSVDNSNPLAYGLPPEKMDVFFNRSPVFRLPRAAQKGVRSVAWFGKGNSLRSGWMLGPQYHNGGVTVVDADVGKGKLFLITPLITFRGQPHGAFKFLFNGVYYGGAETVNF
ncbi:peptidase, partial [bacterium]|nr:peptidase [bacterium]